MHNEMCNILVQPDVQDCVVTSAQVDTEQPHVLSRTASGQRSPTIH